MRLKLLLSQKPRSPHRLDRRLFLFIALAVCLLGFAGCARPSPTEVRVLSAASLTEFSRRGLEQLQLQGTVQGAGSRVLVQQVNNGAKGDVLLLADPELLQALDPSKVETSTIFAQNRLSLVARNGLSGEAEALLSREELTLAVADPQSAPLGRYSEQTLTHFEVQTKIVPLKDASGVVAALQSGHADLALIYQSDEQRVPDSRRLLLIPEGYHSPVHYQAVLLKPTKKEARTFYDFLTSDSAGKLLQEEGFAQPQESTRN